jgi:hypothetical protein
VTYTDEESVRSQHRFLRREEDYTEKSGTILLLKERCFKIHYFTKNGNVLVKGTDYTFQRPRKITLTSAAVGTDYFEILFDSNLSVAELSIEMQKADNYINGVLWKKFVDLVPFNPTPPLIRDIASKLVGVYCLRNAVLANVSAKENPLNLARDLMKEVDKTLDDLIKGRIELIDENGNVIEGTGMDASVGRAGDKLFDTLEDYTEVDYYNDIVAEKTL